MTQILLKSNRKILTLLFPKQNGSHLTILSRFACLYAQLVSHLPKWVILH